MAYDFYSTEGLMVVVDNGESMLLADNKSIIKRRRDVFISSRGYRSVTAQWLRGGTLIETNKTREGRMEFLIITKRNYKRVVIK